MDTLQANYTAANQVTAKAVWEAHQRNQTNPEINPTQIIECPELARELGAASVHFASELGQRSGAYKDRGIENFVETRSEEEFGRGLVTGSTGNCARALLESAQARGLGADLFVPICIPPEKKEALESQDGVTLHVIGATVGESLVSAKQHADREGKLFAHPYDDPRVVTGQGTLGVEIMEALPKTSAVAIPVGGCGLLGGMTAWMRRYNQDMHFIGSEPAEAASLDYALRTGQVRTGLQEIGTLADGASVPCVGKIGFHLVRQCAKLDVAKVSDYEIRRATTDLWERFDLEAETAGALSLGGARMMKHRLAGKHLVIVVSGGSLDRPRYERDIQLR